jgi:uncharacterized protein
VRNERECGCGLVLSDRRGLGLRCSSPGSAIIVPLPLACHLMRETDGTIESRDMLSVTERDGGVTIAVKAVPGASRDRIVGELGGALKVTVAAPPEDGKANRAIMRLLAERLELAESRISITCGQSTARKQFFVAGITPAFARARLGDS